MLWVAASDFISSAMMDAQQRRERKTRLTGQFHTHVRLLLQFEVREMVLSHLRELRVACLRNRASLSISACTHTYFYA